jgi:hypothetical protein
LLTALEQLPISPLPFALPHTIRHSSNPQPPSLTALEQRPTSPFTFALPHPLESSYETKHTAIACKQRQQRGGTAFAHNATLSTVETVDRYTRG